MQAQLIDFRVAFRNGCERHTLVVPSTADGQPDRPLLLIRRVWQDHYAAHRHPDAMLFADPSAPPAYRHFHLASRLMSHWLTPLREVVPLRVPLGGRYKGHSLCKGAAAEAFALGVPIAVVAEMLGHLTTKTSLQSYIKTRWRASSGARELLTHSLPPSHCGKTRSQ